MNNSTNVTHIFVIITFQPNIQTEFSQEITYIDVYNFDYI